MISQYFIGSMMPESANPSELLSKGQVRVKLPRNRLREDLHARPITSISPSGMYTASGPGTLALTGHGGYRGIHAKRWQVGSWVATEYVPDINPSFQPNWANYVTRFQP